MRKALLVAIVVVVMVAAVGAILWWVGRGDVPTDSDTDSMSNSGSTDGPQEASTTASGEAGIPSGATPAIIEFVVDGDTVFLDDGRKVRLLGIDTPEVGDNLECYGDEATAMLRELLPEGAPVWVLPDIDPLDQYGRSLLFIYRDAATNVNLELVRRGAAEVVQYDPNFLLQEELRAAEAEAQAVGAGLWGSC